jgi:hypothetical protein
MDFGNDIFLAGVIEGFYGPPWSQAERFELFRWMANWRLNTYLYAPKDDLKHRALWREPYSVSELKALQELIRACAASGIRFFYALSPGLDIRYHAQKELDLLRSRFEQMMGLGCHSFALLFDDIPDRMEAADLKRFGSFASAQCHVVNELFRWARQKHEDTRFLFCPTPYCGRMAEREYGGRGYLATVGRELLAKIEIFWTGPEIISREITVRHIQELQNVLRRKPFIWDNLHANDYDGGRFYCGPYSGRPLELRPAVKGLLVNPNNEFLLNYVPLCTLAEFVHCQPDGIWEPRTAYLSAMREWLAQFATLGAPIELDDLVLFGDCYYLPYEQGPEAEALYRSIRDFLASAPDTWGKPLADLRARVVRLRSFCARMTELHERPLFYALSRRVWELREELDLLDRYFEFVSDPAKAGTGFSSDFHQPGTYRGGMVYQLQQLLQQRPDGTFVPNAQPDPA